MSKIIWSFSTVPFGEVTWSIWERQSGQPEWEPSHLSMQDVWNTCLQVWSFRTLSSSWKAVKQMTHSVWFMPCAASASLYMNVIECDSKLMQADNLSSKDMLPVVVGRGGMWLVSLHHPSMVRLKNVMAMTSAPIIKIPGKRTLFSCYAQKK